MASPLASLLEPLTIGGITLANRFVMPAMQRMCSADGAPSAEFATYYSSRAAGGAALIISEGAAIDHPSATKFPFVLRLEEDKFDGWAKCADAIHAAGGHFLVQLFHEGAIREEGKGPYPDAPSLSPSGVYRAGQRSGRAATLAELGAIKDAYIRVAVAAKGFGADGVEIHSAHGYLLHQFLWRETNLRTDLYGGGSIQKRVRFAQEIVSGIREAVGSDFLISFRFSQFAEVDFKARVIETPAELETMLGILRHAGVDLFNVSTRRFWEPEWDGSELGLAGWTKSLTDASVCAVGSVGLSSDLFSTLVAGGEDAVKHHGNLLELKRRFEDEQFDLIAVGRGMYADPDWVRKITSDRFEDAIPWSKALLAPLELEPGFVEDAHRSD